MAFRHGFRSEQITQFWWQVVRLLIGACFVYCATYSSRGARWAKTLGLLNRAGSWEIHTARAHRPGTAGATRQRSPYEKATRRDRGAQWFWR